MGGFLNPLSLSEEKVRERFHATQTTIASVQEGVVRVLRLNLSRRDRNRADLSLDK